MWEIVNHDTESLQQIEALRVTAYQATTVQLGI
jgi:hypothetical protein